MNIRTLAACALVCTHPLAAHAQQETVNTLPEVTVRDTRSDSNLERPASTATRLGTTLREIPASVEVIDQKDIREHGKRDVREALELTTGLTAGTNGSTPLTVSARGFTNNGMRYLYDGIDLGSANVAGRSGDAFNLDRIEVIRGPASVLFGEGAIGGAINFITKAPLRTAEPFDLELGIGTPWSARFGIGKGGVLGQGLYYRVDASSSENETSMVGNTRHLSRLTGSLLYDVSSTLTVSLHADYARDNSPDYYFGTPLNNGRIDRGLRKVNYNNLTDNVFRAETAFVRANVEWRPSADWEVRNTAFFSTTHRDWRNIESYSFNPATRLVARSSFGDLDHDQKVYGDRLEALYKSKLAGMENRFSFGAEVNQTRFDSARNGFVGSDVVSADNPRSVDSSLLTGVVYRTQARDVSLDKYSVFAEDQLSLTERLKLVAGVRQDWIHTDFLFLDAGGVTRDPHFTPTSWRAGVVYDVLPSLTVYGSYSNATEPVSTLLLMSAANSQFDLTRGRQYEIGAKGEFLDGRAVVTAAVYDIEKTNVLTRDPNNPALNIQVGKQSSRGIELAGTYRVDRAWRLDGNAALLRAKFDDFGERVGNIIVSRAGNVPTDVPERVYNLGVRYEPAREWYAGAYGRYVGKRYATNANTVVMPSYTTLDLTAGYRFDKNLELALWVRNATDKVYAMWSDSSNTGSQVILGDPRSAELVLRARF